MSPAVSSTVVLGTVVVAGWALVRRSSMLGQATLALSFGFLWMLVDVVYIELGGGVYAGELLRTIGGGSSAATLAMFLGATVIGLLLVFSRPRLAGLRLRCAQAPGPERVFGVEPYTGALIMVGLAVGGAYFELLRGGVPLLAGVDRGAFVSQAGPVVTLLYRYEIYLWLVAGALYFEDVRRGRPGGRSPAAWSAASLVLVYVLIGHKFSGIFFNLLLFAIPASLGGLLDVPRRGRLVTPRRVIVALVLGGLFVATVNAYLGRFAHRAAVEYYLEQRLLVQQGELWWAAHDRVVGAGDWRPAEAIDAVFRNPVAEPTVYTGNTALTYLMYLERGSPAHSLFVNGYLFTGAWPTILLELCGRVGGIAAMFLVSVGYAWLLYLFLWAVAGRRLVLAVFVSLVFGIVHNVMVGGNLMALTSAMFGAKVLALVLAVVADSEWRARGTLRPPAPELSPGAPIAIP